MRKCRDSCTWCVLQPLRPPSFRKTAIWNPIAHLQAWINPATFSFSLSLLVRRRLVFSLQSTAAASRDCITWLHDGCMRDSNRPSPTAAAPLREQKKPQRCPFSHLGGSSVFSPHSAGWRCDCLCSASGGCHYTARDRAHAESTCGGDW